MPKTLTGKVVICGTEAKDPTDVAYATAGAMFDWARGLWGPLEVTICDEEGGEVGQTILVDVEYFARQVRLDSSPA